MDRTPAQRPPGGDPPMRPAASGMPARPGRRFLSAFAENRLALAGACLLLALVLFSFLGPLLYRSDQSSANLALVNLPPSGAHPLGTDRNGYDVLGRLMYGGRSSLEVGLAVGIASTLIGLAFGAVSGYFGGLLDAGLMRLIDIGLAIPVVVLFIFVSTAFHSTLGLLIVVLIAVSWLIPARLVRAEALALRTREYVQAARVMGAGALRIIVRHLVPNTIGTVVVTATLGIANAILTLAVLQYLGFGLPPSVPTWGGMLANGVAVLEDGYWWDAYPALAVIVVTVIAFNLIGDALADAFDVRLGPRRGMQ